MGSSKLEVVRGVVEAVAERDFDRLCELSDPEVEWHSFFALGEEGGTYRGHAGLRRYVDDLDDAWAVVSPEIDDTIEVGEVVLAVGHVRYEGKESGAGADAHSGWVFKFRAGRVLIFRAFADPERALEAVGL
jgi:ketosteroid isomerase-like protein